MCVEKAYFVLMIAHEGLPSTGQSQLAILASMDDAWSESLLESADDLRVGSQSQKPDSHVGDPAFRPVCFNALQQMSDNGTCHLNL